ncbi:DUF4150 domain-containing protein [Rhodovulum euryhalinum]|uniref:Uncharacterized protein DUF4150 n=1 Tax=Rhodovulum euryhalinum TaxID=35805 RepID=A0A4V2SA70_9RHOB|nr:DUF4150 domain-containing protein [Rhodovulum euryhalinum]TCO70540.1 uncharacterized protein DUF4150 [Rhodovulum euryhalinum]
MGDVFANGLEISGKAVQAQTIAAFPDVCMTPPENPATPPGVPVPYPNFAMAGDTEKGTSTVKIKGKIVNLKNKSDMSRTSGDEAGCAAKKGVVSSKNMGKSYFNAWSANVKFEGEPVVRMSDLTTNNHASPVGNAPPWPHIAKLNVGLGDCEKVFAELDGHRHADSPCDFSTTGRNSEHTARASAFMRSRSAGTGCSQWPAYDPADAPCICMNTKRVNKKASERSRKGMPHDRKTKKIDNLLDQARAGCKGPSGSVSCKKACTVPTTGDLVKTSSDATVNEHSRTKRKSKEEKKSASECLELINLAYLAGVEDSDSEEEAKKKVEAVKQKPICTKAVCKAPKARQCHTCGV